MKNSSYISLQKTGDSETIEKLRTNLWDEENRLRAVDITPDAEGVRPIAIYTYDAGGERILKHSNTSVSIYLNGKKVADTIQVDATLYPSGMLVAKLGNNGSEEEQTLAYTKHYFAGTQRVSSKIGTTENLGDYLYDWFTQGTGGPVDVVGSSFGVLENAEEGVIQVYEEFDIEPPVYDSNPVFIPVQSFVHGGNEIEQYFFHPDHLGSTSYITNLLGEVSQHIEYFAFGETFVEEHRSSNNSPYKFNGKELDEETGWYYYGARYYDPRVSVWLSVDPLAEQTMTPYQYTYQNPVRYIDSDGMAAEPPSTHIDERGNVVAVYDDGNLGVYQHTTREIKSADSKGIKLSNDVDRMVGVTLSEYSFERGDKIKVGSFWARDKINNFEIEMHILSGSLGPIANTYNYALGARNGFKYDPKFDGEPFGSQISKGVYVSKRDVGNYQAGAFGRLNSFFSNRKRELLVNYGAFNLANNNFSKFTTDYRFYRNKAINFDSSIQENLNFPGQRTYGEDPISNFFQRLGFEGINTLEKFNSRYSDIWKD